MADLRTGVRSGWAGGQGDGVTESFELADEFAGAAVGVGAALVPVSAEVVIAGVRVSNQLPDHLEEVAGPATPVICSQIAKRTVISAR